MSFQITTWFVQQYGQTVYMLSQQMESRLRNAVLVESGVVGKSHFFDQVGVTAAQKKQGRHTDTPLISTPHDRRMVVLASYEWADLIDKQDRVRTLNDPTNPYVQAGAAAMGRAIDDEIIASFFADAKTGETGSTTTSFPAGQQVAVNSWKFGTGSGNSGLTVSKLIEAKNVLFANESVKKGEELFITCAQRQISDLLATTEVGSRDFNEAMALQKGEVDSFMGFKFIQSERLSTDSNSYRRVAAFSKSGMALAIGQDIQARITERADKSYATQPYMCMDLGATRLEEKKVVEIKCSEA